MHKISKYVMVAVLSAFLLVAVGQAPVPAQAAKDVPMVPANFAELAQIAKPGVVNIRTVRTIKGGGPVFRHFFGEPFGDRRHPFEDFFGPFRNMPEREHKERSLGSGFVIDREGFIVTNNHVVAEADEIKVKLSTGDEYDAEVVGRDPKTDLALIKIKDAKDLTPLPLGDSENLKVGTWVVAIGSPFGLEQTVTQGIVSAKGRSIGSGPYDDYIQTDASINPGNSGGPLLNLKGEVVGINTAIIARGQGIGFAIPIHLAKSVVSQLKEKGEVTRGWLGVQIRDLDESLASYYRLKPFSGVYVENVVPGDPADKAGIRSGDIITSVDGQPVTSGRELAGLVARIPVGKKTHIALMRDGKKRSISVKVAKQSNDKMKIASKRTSKDDLGLRVTEMSSAKAQQFGLDAEEQGVLVIEVAPDSRADKAGVRVGDIIKGVNMKKINGLKDYEALLAAADQDEPINLLVRRRNQGSRGIQIDP
ncbi:MAG: Do family serine endopeptidase [Desulfobacteraceae bacterium]|jgi:serine protease Do